MPSAGGPCRFGQYAGFADMIMRDLGYEDVLILSPTSTNSYDEVGENSRELLKTAWLALVSGDILRYLLHRTLLLSFISLGVIAIASSLFPISCLTR